MNERDKILVNKLKPPWSIPFFTLSQQLLESSSLDPYYGSSPPIFSKDPPSLGGLLDHSIRLHVHHYCFDTQDLDPKWNLF
jgi:hypothetical protein